MNNTSQHQAKAQIFDALKNNDMNAIERLMPLNTAHTLGLLMEDAAAAGQLECIRLLMNKVDRTHQENALVKAAMHQHTQCVAVLLEKITHTDNDAILWSILHKNKDIFHLLHPVSEVTLIMDDLTTIDVAFVNVCLAEQERLVIMDSLPDAPRSRLNKKM